MDLRQLEIVRMVADTGSFTAASRRLHVSQSAVSRQVLILEDELGEPPFIRLGRRVRLTDTGESRRQLSRRVLADISDTTASIVDHQKTLRGTVQLGGGMTVCLHVFPALLKASENVEILKALVLIGMGITIIPYQAVTREVQGGRLRCMRIERVSLVRETGWVYLRTARVPRAVQQLFEALTSTIPRLKLAPPARISRKASPVVGRGFSLASASRRARLQPRLSQS